MGTLLFAAVAVIGVLFGIQYFSFEARTRRALRAVQVREIREVQADTVVRVKGRLRPLGDLLTAPLSGRHCAYYMVTVEELRSSGKSSSWVEIGRRTEGVDFVVEDAGGEIHARAEGLQVAVTLDRHTRSGTFDDATEVEQQVLARMYEESTGLLGLNRTLRYSEGVLEPGEEVTVLGQAQAHERSGGGRVLVLGPTPNGPARATDDPGVIASR